MTDYWQGIKDPKKIFDTWSISEDKSQNELSVVESLFEALSIEASSLNSVAQNDPPDCVFELNSTKIGIEVVGLIDETARSLSAKSRRNDSKEYYAEWSESSFRKHIEHIVHTKDNKIKNGIKSGCIAASCDEFWLAIHTDEMTLYSSAVVDFIGEWKILSNIFKRVYLVLAYEPGRSDNGYPIFKLN